MAKKPVLIVDDEAAIREMLKSAFGLHDFPVQLAGNGREALEMLRAGPRPGMIVLDYKMPVMDGQKFAEELVKNGDWAKIPVILVTAYPHMARVPLAVHVMDKPFDLDALIDAAREYCGSGSA